jgi:hypothetical protein
MIVYLDTNVVIYAVENHPSFGPRAVARLAGEEAYLAKLTLQKCGRIHDLLTGRVRV